MSEDKKTGSNSWERTDGYKPEWAREFDIDTPHQRSDSESFNRAVEMGIEAAEGLEREKLRASSSSGKHKKPQDKEKQSKKGYRGRHVNLDKKPQDKEKQGKKGTLIDTRVILLMLPVYVLLALFGQWLDDSLKGEKPSYSTQHDNSSYSSVPEPPSIEPEKQDDGSYHVHIELGSTPDRVEIPTELARSHGEPWIMRVRGDIGESTFSHCGSQLLVHNASGNYWDRIEQYPDWCGETKEHAFEHMVSFPTEFNRGIMNPVVLDFSGWNAQLDIDFFPISAVAVPWNTSEPLKGSDSTVVRFSGSLEGLRLSFDSARVSFRVYDPTNHAYFDLAPYDVPDVTEHFSSEAKSDVIKKLGFDRDDASGYIFVEVKEKSQTGTPSWQLN